MPNYVIKRERSGAGSLSPDELRALSQKSCGVLNRLGPQTQWIESYGTADNIYCIHRAPNEEMIREHAPQVAFRQIESLKVSSQIRAPRSEL